MHNITLISDLHLEYNDERIIELPNADILVCAGDIGSPFTKSYKNFLQSIIDTHNYKYIIVIAGNHEYYQHSEGLNLGHPRSMKDVEEQIKVICEELGVIFLQKSVFELPDVIFYGCTLWADPSISKGESEWRSRYDANHISDFKTVKDYIRLHEDHKNWLMTQLSKKSNKRKVVISHHVPSYQLVEKHFKGSSKNGYYVSPCDHLIEKADLWLCGHTHAAIDQRVRGVRCVCNPIAYPWEKSPYTMKIIKI